ncbi:MAG: hypothetical protein HZB57_06470 [Gammaproteobacteria bacterium]|nr:hypothetical protein [Gammaproteobacteria bacterium]
MQTQTISNQKPLITPFAPAGEEDRVAGVLEEIKQRLGFVPDGLRLYTLSPPLLENFVGGIAYFNGGSRLRPMLMAMIRYLVSWHSQCQFCIDMNEGFLTAMGLQLDEIRAARANPEAAPLPENEMPLLRIALKSVEHPDNVTQTDLDKARTHGWQDRDIFDAVVQAANNRAFNQVLRTFNIEYQGAFG